MASLADRIESVLLVSAPLTASSVSRHIRARDIDVRDALKLDPRFVAVKFPGRSEKAIGWMLRADHTEPRDDWGRVAA